jgi:hypothetical protein
MSRFATPETIVNALAIRDTSNHTPSTDPEISFHNVGAWLGWTIRVVNGLDQPVTLTLYGNTTNSETNADSYATTLTVAANSVGFITFHGRRGAWTPWVYCQLACTTAPTSGSVTVTITKFDRMRPD